MYKYAHLLGCATGYPKRGHKQRRRRRRRRNKTTSGSSGVATTKEAGSSVPSQHTGVPSAGGGTFSAPAHLPPHPDGATGSSIIGGSTDAPNLIDLQADTQPSIPGDSINGLMETLNLN